MNEHRVEPGQVVSVRPFKRLVPGDVVGEWVEGDEHPGFYRTTVCTIYTDTGGHDFMALVYATDGMFIHVPMDCIDSVGGLIMYGTGPKSEVTGVPGWMTQSEEIWLCDVIKHFLSEWLADLTVVQIGGEWGRSAAALATCLPDTARIVTVDLFPENYQNSGHNLLDIHKSNLAKAGLEGRTEQWVGDSVAAAGRWRKPIDVLFVDGGHEYEQAWGDLDAWVPFVRPGTGLIILHDYAKDDTHHHLHIEVKRAADDFFTGSDAYDVDWELSAYPFYKRVDGPDSMVAFVDDGLWNFHELREWAMRVGFKYAQRYRKFDTLQERLLNEGYLRSELAELVEDITSGPYTTD